MAVYFIKNKGYRYEFVLKGKRHTKAWFKTKTAAKLAEAKRREELENPDPSVQEEPTDMAFLDLVNIRLDHIQDRKSEIYYEEHVYKARKWVEEWGNLNCGDISKKSD